MCHVRFDHAESGAPKNIVDYSEETLMSNCASVLAKIMDLLESLNDPECLNELMRQIYTLRRPNDTEFIYQGQIENALIHIAKVSRSSTFKRWALTFLRKNCERLYRYYDYVCDTTVIKENLFSISYDLYANDAYGDVKLNRLLEKTIYDLKMSSQDWLAKVQTDPKYISNQCIADSDEILQNVVERPNQWALYSQKFQEVLLPLTVPIKWIPQMPSILIILYIYDKLYSNRLYPFFEDLKRNKLYWSSSNVGLSQAMDKLLLFANDGRAANVEYKVDMVRTQLNHNKDAPDVNVRGTVDLDEISFMEIFGSKPDEEAMGRFIQEVCLIITAGPASQMPKIACIVLIILKCFLTETEYYIKFALEDFVKVIQQAITSRTSNIAEWIVYHPPQAGNHNPYYNNAMLNGICSFVVICSSPILQQCSTNELIDRFRNDVNKILSHYRFIRNCYLQQSQMEPTEYNDQYCERMLQFLAKAITLGYEGYE
ncbi:hypothetical protein INT43_001099 [Umbelopsis isabellina]|uniref:Uncharacterized protein n=1 Tax=Mortierella isabellina TaxID=91625 RepID=A0A8H7PK10_MORIS|nr:hypothetical protein INT43_001099 [Umbelopsis isabellina]